MTAIVLLAVCPPCLARVAYVDPFDPAASSAEQTVVGQNPNGPSLRVVLAGSSAASMQQLADWTNQMARWLNPKSAIDPYDPAHFKADLTRVLGADFGHIDYVYWNAPPSPAQTDFVLTLEIRVVLGRHSFAQNQIELDGTLSATGASNSDKLVGLGESKVGFPAFVTHFDEARVAAFDQFGQSLRGSRLMAPYQTASGPDLASAGGAAGSEASGFGATSGSGTPGGMYAVDSNVPFNVLDSVYFDPASGKLALIGHHDDRFTGPAIPYLQYLATLLESPKPEFSLDWTPDSARRVDALLASEMSQQESDAQAARLAAMVDASGNVTRVGALMLPALGIYPIKDNRAPGDMGVTVDSINGGRVVLLSVKPGSAADRAGLKPLDFISEVRSGRPVYFHSEFDRQVRAAGAGATIQVTYQRNNGPVQSTELTLDAADDADPWHGVNRYDVVSMLYRGAGDPQAAEVVDAFELFNAMTTQNEQKAGWLPYIALMQSLHMEGDFAQLQQLQQAAPSHVAPYQDNYNFGMEFAQRLDSTFHLAGNPLQQFYENQVAQSHDPGGTLSLVMTEFDKYLTPKVSDLMGRLVSRPGVGFQIPPELVEDEYHIHPEMTPQYLGVPAHSLLAKLMLDSDYLCKRLSNEQDLKRKIPGYQTMVEYQVNHPDEPRPARSAYRVWISVANVDAAQSSDGMSLALRNATMHFNIRQTGTGLQHQDLPGEQSGGYQDVLTGLYDPFEQQFPTLHALREAAKLATTSIWLQQKQPAFQLPADGRVSWNGPQTVPGLVYIYLATDLQQQSQIFKIAEGGVSLVPPHLIPTDPSVVDLRGNPGFATLVARPESATGASWVSAAGSGASPQQALVLDTRASNFGTRVSNPVLPLRDEKAGAVGTDTNANHQLNAIATGDRPLGNAPSGEAAGATSQFGFDTGVKTSGAIDTSQVAAPPAGDDELVIPEDMLGDVDVGKLVDYKKQARQSHAAAAAAQASYEAEKSRDPTSPQLAVLQVQARDAQDKASNLDNMVKFEKAEIKRKISFKPIATGAPTSTPAPSTPPTTPEPVRASPNADPPSP